ncbi:unnamed protein product [Sphacelaria rigidula]
MYTTSEATNIDYCREREAFGHPMLCVRSLSLYNALRRSALRHGCELVSGVSCRSVSPVLGQEEGNKQAVLVLTSQEGGKRDVVTADFVVGADGLKSVIRQHLGDSALPRDAECVWVFGIVGHVACPVLLRSRIHTFFMSEPGKAASLMPVGDHTYWAVALTGDDRMEAMELSSRHEEVREFVKRKFGEECPGLVDLVDATPPNQIHRRRIEDRPALRSFVSGVRSDEFYCALVGDAAHPGRPSLGQGANMALEDAVQLALLLRDTDSVEEALTEYDAARVLRCATLQGDSEFVARRRERQDDVEWRTSGEHDQEQPSRAANQGMGNPEFVYNWEPARLHRFPWKREITAEHHRSP